MIICKECRQEIRGAYATMLVPKSPDDTNQEREYGDYCRGENPINSCWDKVLNRSTPVIVYRNPHRLIDDRAALFRDIHASATQG